MNKYTPEFCARFWSKVSKSIDSNACWNWNAGKDRYGYGKVGYNRRTFVASRIAYELTYGAIDGLEVLHECDNPACCNPRHLKLGTHAQNMDDKKQRGRSGANGVPELLTHAQKLHIRELYASTELTQDQLAYELGVSASTIRKAIHRK